MSYYCPLWQKPYILPWSTWPGESLACQGAYADPEEEGKRGHVTCSCLRWAARTSVPTALSSMRVTWGDPSDASPGPHPPPSTARGTGRRERKASPSVTTACPHGTRTKQRRKLLPLIPSLVPCMHLLLKNATQLHSIGLLWNLF